MYKEIVSIVGMPRSGTSWLSQIVDSSPQVCFRLSPLFSYQFKNMLNNTSSKKEWEYVFNGAYNSDNTFMNQSERRISGEYPVFLNKEKTLDYLVIKATRFHNLIDNMMTLFENLKTIAIVRHPCGSINSWISTPNEFPQDATPDKEWRKGTCRKSEIGEFWGFDDWKKVTKLHMKLKEKYPDRFYIQKYEALVDEPLSEAKKIFSFLQLKMETQTFEFIEQCHEIHSESAYGVYKNPNVKNRWKTELDINIRREIIEDLQNTDLEIFIK